MEETILIVGTGALATLFAHRLSRVGIEVIVLGSWEAGLSALHQQGARLDDVAGIPLRVMTDVGKLERVKSALILVKSWQTPRAGLQLEKCLATEGTAVTLQNGLGNDAILAEILGRQRVGRGITTIGATLLDPGHAHLGGEGLVVLEKAPQTSALGLMLRRARFQVEMSDNIESQIWAKLVLNAGINPVTALLAVKNGSLPEIPSAKVLMQKIAGEAVSVAQAEGISLPFSDVGALLEEVACQSGDNVSSMLQDVLRGSHTEVDAINGKIVQLGAKHHLATPFNELMVLLVNALTERGKINAIRIG